MAQQTGYVGCGQRIPDHTDFIDCGVRPTVGDTHRCEKCLTWYVENLRQDIAKREIEIAANRTEYKNLRMELERHRFPLLAKAIG